MTRDTQRLFAAVMGSIVFLCVYILLDQFSVGHAVHVASLCGGVMFWIVDWSLERIHG